MKKTDHDYWAGEYAGTDADRTNPDLRIAMRELYGRKGFDFGKVNDEFYDKDRRNHYRPDGYSSYTSLTGNYMKKMPFRSETVQNNKELADRCYFLAVTIAGELFFPARMLGCNTINQARGRHPAVNDMVHHTLESIRKYYGGTGILSDEDGDRKIRVLLRPIHIIQRIHRIQSAAGSRVTAEKIPDE